MTPGHSRCVQKRPGRGVGGGFHRQQRDDKPNSNPHQRCQKNAVVQNCLEELAVFAQTRLQERLGQMQGRQGLRMGLALSKGSSGPWKSDTGVSSGHLRGMKQLPLKSVKQHLWARSGIGSSYIGWLSKLWSPFGSLNTRCSIILRTQKGTIILTTTHIHHQGLQCSSFLGSIL